MGCWSSRSPTSSINARARGTLALRKKVIVSPSLSSFSVAIAVLQNRVSPPVLGTSMPYSKVASAGSARHDRSVCQRIAVTSGCFPLGFPSGVALEAICTQF